MSTQLIELNPLGLIRISGADAAKFLQGQLACDVSKIDDKHSGFTAYCNVKGRVVAVARIFFFNEAYFLLLPKDLLNKTFTLLTKYKLAAKVILEDVTEKFIALGVIGELDFIDAAISNLAINENVVIKDAFISRVPDKTPRYLIITKKENNAFLTLLQHLQKQPFDLWQGALIENGIPFISNATSEMFTAEMLNLIDLGAVSLTKGCFLGQEIIARAHHLGKTKRLLVKAKIKTAQKPELASKLVNSNNEEVGNIILVSGVEVNDYFILAVVSETALHEQIFLEINHARVEVV